MLNCLLDGISHNFLLTRGSYVNLYQTEFLLYFISELQPGFPFRGQPLSLLEYPYLKDCGSYLLWSPLLLGAPSPQGKLISDLILILHCMLTSSLKTSGSPDTSCPFAKYIEGGGTREPICSPLW